MNDVILDILDTPKKIWTKVQQRQMKQHNRLAALRCLQQMSKHRLTGWQNRQIKTLIKKT